MTYSIIARDPATGCLGVAVQSGVLAVGTRVPAARPGLGAVVTQAGAELTWRAALLDLLATGLTAAQAVAAARTFPGADAAQIAVLDAAGGVAAHTGPGCPDHTGHHTGDGVSVQANLVAAPTVWPAMHAAYAESTADLPERLVAALHAAEREGGDVRGPQSAGLLVVGPVRGALSTGYPDDPVFDLRVDDSRDPVGELDRLLVTARAHRHLIRAGLATDAATEDAALRAAAALAPDDPTVLRSAGITLALHGHHAEAFSLLDRAAALDPRVLRWARRRGAEAAGDGNPHGRVLLDRLGPG